MISDSQIRQIEDQTGFRGEDILKFQRLLIKNKYAIYPKKITNQSNEQYQYLLGRGGQALVFYGINIQTEQEVAIKISVSSQNTFDDMKKEVESIKQIDNFENIIQVYESFILEEEKICIQIIEICEGSLDKELLQKQKDKKGYSQDQIEDIFLQLLDALCEIHEKNIIHFDIKPQNILITKNGKYKLADFGMSQNLDINASHLLASRVGTLNYASPEQFQNGLNILEGKDKLKIRSSTDIYSLGVTLLEVIGIKMGFSEIANLREKKYSFLELQVTDENYNYFSFIKFYMLQEDQEKRYSAFKLRSKFIQLYSNETLLKNEQDRINIDRKRRNKATTKKMSLPQAYVNYLYSTSFPKQLNDQFITKAIEIFQQQNRRETLEYSLFLQHYSQIMMNLGKHEIAKEIYVEAIKIKQNFYNNQHVETAYSLLGLAEITSFINADIDQSLEYAQQAQSLFKSNFGETHPEIADCLSLIGTLYAYQGEYKKAFEFTQKALRMRNFLFKGDHLDLGISYNNLGYIQQCLGGQESKESHSIAFQIFNNKGNKLLLALSYNHLGKLKDFEGQLKSGLEDKLKSLEIRQRFYVKEHPDIVSSLNSIGNSQNLLGNYQEGIKYHLKALEMIIAIYSNKSHPDVAATLNNVGISYEYLEDFEKALEYYEKSLQMYKEIYDNKHPDLIIILNNVGSFYDNRGKHKQAQQKYNEAIRICQQAYGSDHPEYATILSSLGCSYFLEGNFSKALESQLKALQIQRYFYPTNNATIAQYLYNIALTYDALNLNKESLEFQTNALAMRQIIFEQAHPDLLDSFQHMSSLQQKIGNKAKSNEYLQQFQSMQKKLKKGK